MWLRAVSPVDSTEFEDGNPEFDLILNCQATTNPLKAQLCTTPDGAAAAAPAPAAVATPASSAPATCKLRLLVLLGGALLSVAALA